MITDQDRETSIRREADEISDSDLEAASVFYTDLIEKIKQERTKELDLIREGAD